MSGVGKSPDRAAEPPGQPPSRPPPFQGGGEKAEAARPRPGDSDVGEVPDALTLWLLPPSEGRSGGGSRPWVRRRPAGLARSANEGAGRRDAGAPWHFTDERGREEPRPGRRAPGSTPLPTSPLPGGRREDGGGAPPARRQRRRRGTRRPDSLAPPPFRGEVGRGVPPLGAPASRRPRAKRERGCGPSARQAGGTPALPGNSRMSGIGKAPVRATGPLDQPPSRPPLFQGGGEKAAASALHTPSRSSLRPPPRGEETGARAGAGAAACAAAARPP